MSNLARAQGFYYGFQDGFSGLVQEPMRGAKEEGGVGVAKGIARGIAGLVLKPGAGGEPVYLPACRAQADSTHSPRFASSPLFDADPDTPDPLILQACLNFRDGA